jgi:hypothetical protein
MEHIETIEIIINSKKEYLTKKEYKSFCNVMRNIIQVYNKNMEFKKISDSFLQYSCIILLDIIDTIKEHIRDIDYMNYMESFKFLVIKFKEHNDNYDNYDFVDYHHYNDDDNHQIIDIDLLFERVEYYKSILNDFIEEKNLPIDFIDSSFNVAELTAYNYIYDTCSCNNKTELCEKYYYCKNIQKYILNNPLMFIIINCSYYDTDKICYDINKYNLFSFDGKINDEFSLNLTNPKYTNDTKDINFMFNIFNSSSYLMKLLVFINIVFTFYTKHYNLLNNERFRKTLYSKIIEFKEDYNETKWYDKLNLDINLLDIVLDSLKERIPMEIFNSFSQ